MSLRQKRMSGMSTYLHFLEINGNGRRCYPRVTEPARAKTQTCVKARFLFQGGSRSGEQTVGCGVEVSEKEEQQKFMETMRYLECPTSTTEDSPLVISRVPDANQQLHSFSMLLIFLLKITFSSKLPPN